MPQTSDWQTLFDALLAIFTLVAAVAAWRSANAAKHAAQETRKGTQAQLSNSLLDAYASDEMLDAMLELQGWAKENGEQFADKFRKLRAENYSKVKTVDRARRRVSHYFEKVYGLWKEDFIDEKSVRTIVSKDQIAFLREIVEPLEAALNPQYERAVFEALGGLYSISARQLPMANP